jgi:hypothetical protein
VEVTLPGAQLELRGWVQFAECKHCKPTGFGFNCAMQALERIEQEVRQLSKAEQEELRDWLDNMLEDELEFTDEFKAKIDRAKRDIADGRGRVVKP